MATATRSHSPSNGTSSGNGAKGATRRSPEPRLGQQGKELQRFGTLRQLPIALPTEARKESCRLLNEILADSTILYSLFWKRFNTRGALWSIYGGLTSAIVLIIFSPTVSGGKVTAGKAASMITDPSIDFHWFPLANPGLISIPLGFFLGWLGTVTSKEHNEAKYVEMEVRSLTGAGAEKEVLRH